MNAYEFIIYLFQNCMKMTDAELINIMIQSEKACIDQKIEKETSDLIHVFCYEIMKEREQSGK